MLCGQQLVRDRRDHTWITDPPEHDLEGALDRPHGVVHPRRLVTAAPDAAQERDGQQHDEATVGWADLGQQVPVELTGHRWIDLALM